MSKKETYFQDSWLSNEHYKLWVKRVSDKNTSARCRLCLKNIELSNMGERALNSHANGQVHTEKVKTVLAVQNFFKKRVTPSVQQQQPNQQPNQQPMQDDQEPASPSNSESTTPNSSTSNAQQQTMDYLIVSNRTLKAEINFLVFSITKGHSWNSFVGLNQILQDIFPDSQIV